MCVCGSRFFLTRDHVYLLENLGSGIGFKYCGRAKRPKSSRVDYRRLFITYAVSTGFGCNIRSGAIMAHDDKYLRGMACEEPGGTDMRGGRKLNVMDSGEGVICRQNLKNVLGISSNRVLCVAGLQSDFCSAPMRGPQNDSDKRKRQPRKH